MADWAAFTGFTGLVLVVLLSFAYFSRGIPHADGVTSRSSESTDVPEAADNGSSDSLLGGTTDGESTDSLLADATVLDSDDTTDLDSDDTTDLDSDDTESRDPASQSVETRNDDRLTPTPVLPPTDTDAAPADIPTHLLIVNVAVSQALLGGFLATGAWYAGVPASALGLSAGNLPTKLALGVALGVALYGFNRAGSSLSRRFGFAPDEALRESLTPETLGGWVLLLFVALPLIAGFEELLFRGALIGALATGFDVSPWLLAAVSSVAFGAGHTAQGRLGIVVTGLLGFVLAATFVLTESLLVVVVAHYLVNALEFVGNELFGW
ncbi:MULTISPECIES: CPBP family intramembrane glutamic endopeptidase [Haloferax]|uniref:CPBP family intramembrane metalloprotease n=1 Tax=Haloferax marinum TaxID=2666143 RepID=A0A6A8G472_9EURY|nr:MULTISPECIES: CPBP family intramembrane glutamic endopeptidase [Haloferax]KAB1196997.1 CPBP family intramembrane metalloprotease [Haloferax sp. CBA1150]MRW96020.1 CPBP family intramembrane metalloprotease [Haloferax marinum]